MKSIISKCCGFPAMAEGNTTCYYVCGKCEKPCDTWVGWHIQYNPKPIPSRSHDFDIWHDDLERLWTAPFRKDALKLIEEIMEENRMRDETEKEEYEKIFNMGFHESRYTGEWVITKVHGGWIYLHKFYNTSCFVPCDE